ncbi:DUF2971 domain-containing protein [Streptomyces sp. NBC_01352]|uniref:DUF2971 domain-containing protein n=1 Tax=Streptomyces sp. NBC_01352 TaxID=2903834 RepID=UPI002E2F59D8|nr:DUF2971 domain-containing protein [Streptomyces sp. NBC_01352]
MNDIPPEIYPDWLDLKSFYSDENFIYKWERLPPDWEGWPHLEYSRPRVAPDKVYHYTSAAGLLGIISTCSLHAGDVTFLNDSRELTYAGDNLLHALRQEREAIALNSHMTARNLQRTPQITAELSERQRRRAIWGRHLTKQGSLGAIKSLSTLIQELEQMCGPSRSSPLHVYVSCFCENGDLLSQWRGYGGVGGYAIGFRSDVLEKRAKGFPVAVFENVRYGFDESLTSASELFPEYLKSGMTLMADYLRPLTLIKNDAFREEREWRVMVARDCIDELTKFRVGPVGVTPFVSVDFSPEDVGELIVGPGPHSAERVNGTHQLLDRYGMKHVRVVLSETSLRL